MPRGLSSYIETFNNIVLNYADVKKFDEIIQNRPVIPYQACYTSECYCELQSYNQDIIHIPISL